MNGGFNMEFLLQASMLTCVILTFIWIGLKVIEYQNRKRILQYRSELEAWRTFQSELRAVGKEIQEGTFQVK